MSLNQVRINIEIVWDEKSRQSPSIGRSAATAKQTNSRFYSQARIRSSEGQTRRQKSTAEGDLIATYDSIHSDNEFELIYKVKNSGKSSFPFDEQSFESLLLLKSKNKIKRFSNKTKREEKSGKKSTQPNPFQSTSSGLARNTQDGFHREKQMDKSPKQQDLRLLGLHSQERRPTSPASNKFKSPRKSVQKSKIVPSAGNSHVDSVLKRTKSAQFHLKISEVEAQPQPKKFPQPRQQPKRSNRNSNPDLRAPRSQIVKPVAKQTLTKSRRQRHEQLTQIKPPVQENDQYIMLDNQIYAAENLEDLEGEISSMLVQRATESRLVNRNAGEIEEIDEQDILEEEFYSIRKYYDEKATLIQKVFRGYLVRKYVRLHRQQQRREYEAALSKKRISLELKSKENPFKEARPQPEQLCLEDQFQPDMLVMPSRQYLSHSSAEDLSSASMHVIRQPTSDRLGGLMSEFERLTDQGQKQQLLSRLKQFIKEKQSPKDSSDRSNRSWHQKEAQSSGGDVTETLLVRENAVDLRLTTQHNILRKLLKEGKLQPTDYDRRLVSVETWAHQEKQEIHRLKQLLRSNVQRAAEIVKKAQEDIAIVERVTLGQEKQTQLQKVLDSIPSHSADGFFFYPQDGMQERPKTTGWHSGSPHPKRSQKQATELEDPTTPMTVATASDHNYNTNLKEIIEELKERQKVKADIELRIAIQMSYIKPMLLTASAINTSMQAMHHFLTNFFRFVQEYYQHEFLRMINMPYGYSPERRLRFLQGYVLQQSGEELILEDGMVEGVEKVIGTDIFAEFQQQYYVRRELKQRDKPMIDEKAILYESIHNRAVFDAFNQALNLFRPYYLINGPPYLWNISERALTFYFIAEENIDEVFEKTKYKVMKWASTLCGLQLPEYEQAPPIDDCDEAFGRDDHVGDKSTCHKVLTQCRDERLLKCIKHQITDTDYQWSMHEEERTDIMMDIATMLVGRLLEEVALDIFSFF